MTDKEMWEKFRAEYDMEDCGYDAWKFGDDADRLADLTVKGEKTATASAYILYEIENEDLPEEGSYSIVLDSEGEAVCIIQTTRVYVVPFDQVTEEHACKEGEGDRSLAYWRSVHKAFFSDCLAEAGREFDERMEVVCEEFKLVYKL